MKLVATGKAEQNRAAVDPWTLVHLSTGLAFGLSGRTLRRSLAAALVYEVVEQLVERKELGHRLFGTHGPETLVNATVDVAAFAAGHRLGRSWNETGD